MKTLRIQLAAPLASFSKPLFVPAVGGFGNHPGSIESYAVSFNSSVHPKGILNHIYLLINDDVSIRMG
jgi:hypothetical protein